MTQADRIRAHVLNEIIRPAREEGATEITVRTGDIHKELGLSNAMPAVCGALGGKKFCGYAGVSIKDRRGPRAGSNVYITYDLSLAQVPQYVEKNRSVDALLRKAAIFSKKERYEDAIPYWEQAAGHGSAEAQYNLWNMHQEGWGGLEDFKAGLSFLKRSAAQGYGQAELELAEYYAEEIIGEDCYAKQAIKWGTRAFQHGFVEGATIVGNMYAVDRPGVMKDDAKAFDWFLKAAEAGDAYAQYQVGVSYEHGWGVGSDLDRALHWYRTGRAVFT